MGKISHLLDVRIGGATDSRWGFCGTMFSLGWAFLAFAFSFYAINNGGKIMFTSGWMIAALIFGVIGIAFIICSIVVGLRWFIKPLQNTTPKQLGNIEGKIDEFIDTINNLIQEIRRGKDGD